MRSRITSFLIFGFMISSIFIYLPINLNAQPDDSVPILSRITVKDSFVTSTPSNIRYDASNCFDGNPNTKMISTNINPAFVQVVFPIQQSVTQLRVLLGEPGYPHINKSDWWVEAADTQDDLDSKTGSYQAVVPKRFNVAGVWDDVTLSETVSKSIWKFWVHRTTFDDYVHIPELELWTTVYVSDGTDLDVTYISREPRYKWNSAKKWPDQGEIVTFTAHIVNKGTKDSGPFTFEWSVNNKVVASGTAESIPPHGETAREFTWEWQSGRHYISFRADSQNVVTEYAEGNNFVEAETDALTIAFWVEESVYNKYNTRKNISVGTYSWEDWAHQIIEKMNWIFRYSKYPLAPHGIYTRVRLDKVTIVENGTLFHINSSHAPEEKEFDGLWGFSVEEYLNAPDNWFDVPWWVIHELGHQMFGLVDLYGLDVDGMDVNVLDDYGNRIAGTSLLPYISRYREVHNASRIYDIMRAPTPYSILSDHSTYYINKYWESGQRTHRIFGAYLYEIPNETKIRVLNKNDQPLANVKVKVFQAQVGDGSSGPYSQDFDNIPDIVGMTDSLGFLSLGNNLFPNPPREPEKGHILLNILLLELQHPVSSEVRYVWIEAVDLNIAYHRGETNICIHDVYFPEGPKLLRLNKDEVIFSAVQGSSNPYPQKVEIDILGEGAQYWSVSSSSVPWMRTIPSPDISSYSKYPPGPLTFIVDNANLGLGTYTTQVIIDAGTDTLGNPKIVTIILNVKSGDIINVNNYLTGEPDQYSYSFNEVPVPDGPAGTFLFSADFCNISNTILGELQSATTTLSNGNVLINREPVTPPVIGAKIMFPTTGGFTDSKLEPGECVRVDYEIGLASDAPFDFFVDVYGLMQ